MAEPEQNDMIDAILDFKDAEPFSAFYVVMTSGDRYRIESGQTLVELKNQFFYASPRSKKFVFLRKSEIVAVEVEEEVEPTRKAGRRDRR